VTGPLSGATVPVVGRVVRGGGGAVAAVDGSVAGGVTGALGAAVVGAAEAGAVDPACVVGTAGAVGAGTGEATVVVVGGMGGNVPTRVVRAPVDAVRLVTSDGIGASSFFV
jgi:hypothetical protein